MHPQVRLSEPGLCPICGMDLIPAHDDGTAHPRRLVLTETARKLAEIQTAPVIRGPAAQSLPLVGRVTYDETLVRRASSYVPGRIERLFVDVTGTRVKKGEHLLRIYSPELLAAQTELADASRRARALPDESPARRVLLDTARAAEERLRLWGLGASHIDELKRGGKPRESLTIFAPQSGVVIEKHAVEGMYVSEGTPLYTVADLDRVWVELDVFETDLSLVRFGQPVALSTEVNPSQVHEGKVVFIAPVVDDNTRTVQVRVNVDNHDGWLKPGMLVRAELRASVDADGHAVLSEDLKGAYVCSMHPDVVKDHPGTCDVCGMKLLPAAELGLVSSGATALPLLIPATAPLLTGRRAVVYVEVGGEERPTYEGREVRLGPRVGERYVVIEGLVEGERVVTQGAFKLDAAMQVQARPSMMSQAADVGQGSSDARPAVTSETAAALADFYRAYLDVEEALTQGDVGRAKAAGRVLADVAQTAPVAALLAENVTAVHAAANRVAGAADVEGARSAFATMSEVVVGLALRVGSPAPLELFAFFCPMAEQNRGAVWLEGKDELTNPYFGDAMLKCGEARGQVPPLRLFSAAGEGKR